MNATEAIPSTSDVIGCDELAASVVSLLLSPDVLLRLNTLMQDSDANRDEIAEVIACDPALTAQVLKMANSLPSAESDAADSIADAIELIGTEDLQGMIFASAANDVFAGIPQHLTTIDEFWHHSICCALAADSLARRSSREDLGRVFVTGLLHDIGQLPIYERLPAHAEQVLQQAGEPEQYRYRAEKDIIGYTHAQVGAELLRCWNLPQRLWEPVAYHHEPRRARAFAVETNIIHIATNIANVIEPSWKTSGDLSQSLGIIDPLAWEVTGLSEQDMEPVLEDVMMFSFDVTEIIAPDAMTII